MAFLFRWRFSIPSSSFDGCIAGIPKRTKEDALLSHKGSRSRWRAVSIVFFLEAHFQPASFSVGAGPGGNMRHYRISTADEALDAAFEAGALTVCAKHRYFLDRRPPDGLDRPGHPKRQPVLRCPMNIVAPKRLSSFLSSQPLPFCDLGRILDLF